VRFRNDNYVSYLSLPYKPFRPTTDCVLRTIAEQRQDDLEFHSNAHSVREETVGGTDDKVPVLSSAMPSTTPVAGKDPRWRADYKTASTYDGERTVWSRSLQTDPRFHIRWASSPPTAPARTTL